MKPPCRFKYPQPATKAGAGKWTLVEIVTLLGGVAILADWRRRRRTGLM